MAYTFPFSPSPHLEGQKTFHIFHWRWSRLYVEVLGAQGTNMRMERTPQKNTQQIKICCLFLIKISDGCFMGIWLQWHLKIQLENILRNNAVIFCSSSLPQWFTCHEQETRLLLILRFLTNAANSNADSSFWWNFSISCQQLRTEPSTMPICCKNSDFSCSSSWSSSECRHPLY